MHVHLQRLKKSPWANLSPATGRSGLGDPAGSGLRLTGAMGSARKESSAVRPEAPAGQGRRPRGRGTCHDGGEAGPGWQTPGVAVAWDEGQAFAPSPSSSRSFRCARATYWLSVPVGPKRSSLEGPCLWEGQRGRPEGGVAGGTARAGEREVTAPTCPAACLMATLSGSVRPQRKGGGPLRKACACVFSLPQPAQRRQQEVVRGAGGGGWGGRGALGGWSPGPGCAAP